MMNEKRINEPKILIIRKLYRRDFKNIITKLLFYFIQESENIFHIIASNKVMVTPCDKFFSRFSQYK